MKNEIKKNYKILSKPTSLKGLRHAILGNFSTDQIAIELT